MLKKNLCSPIFLLFSALATLALGYEMPNKIDVVLIPNISYIPGVGTFIYSYSGVSSPKSIQEVNIFFLPNNVNCSNVKAPNGWGGWFKPDLNSKWPEPKLICWFASWAEDDPRGKIIPTHSNVDPSPNQIKPGHALTGFSFESKGIPGVIPFYVEGFTRLPEFPAGMAVDPDPAKSPLADAFQGNTIGPIVLNDSSLGGLMDRLITLKDSMPGFGWLNNQGIINSFNAKLNAAKENIAKSNNKTAKNQLNAFINELDAQKGKQVNENAWALLRANAEYLISKLGE